MAWGGEDTAQVVAPPPLLFLGTLVAALAADHAALGRSPRPTRASIIAGASLLLAGVGLTAWTFRVFKDAGTNIVPNRPSTALITDGPFRYSRNPNYIGQALIYAGIATALRSGAAMLALAPLMVIVDRLIVKREEAYLARIFGPSYQTFRQQVPRWL